MLSQRKKVTMPPFDPAPYCVEDVKRDPIVIKRGGKKLVRNKAQLKLLNPRPERLHKKGTVAHRKQEDSTDDEDYSMEAIRNRGGRSAANADEVEVGNPNGLVEEEREATENTSEEEGGPQGTDAEEYARVGEAQSEADAGGSTDYWGDYGQEVMQAARKTGDVETVEEMAQVTDRQQRQRNAAVAQKVKNRRSTSFKKLGIEGRSKETLQKKLSKFTA